MFKRWLKSYLPRGLFGRATLILLLPVVTLVLVVSIVFIQRHFEGVTRQMVQTVAREIHLVRQADDPAIGEALGISLRAIPEAELPPRNIRRWFDFSGIVVEHEMRQQFPDLVRIALPDDKDVQLYFRATAGLVELIVDRQHVSARRPHLLFVNVAGFGALITLISYVYLRNQLRPITRLARAAEAFGRGQNLPYKPAGAVEVRAAGQAFVDMRARIERQMEQRTLMLSGVSHDLRTPLTRLRLGLAMIDEAEAEPMLRDVADMERLLDVFLDFARGAHAVEVAPVDPIALVRQVVDDAARAQADVTLVEAVGEGCVDLRADSLRRAVENLINNAVRYGRRAEVSVVLSDARLRIRVEDDGPGIAPENREEAIKPFVRLDRARNQNRATGVGLGLSIAADVAQTHGGALNLDASQRLGGLRAEIVIPRAARRI